MSEKYDNSKSFKIGNSHITKLQNLSDIHHFSSDSEVVRFAIDFLDKLTKYKLFAFVVSKILEAEKE